MATIRRSPVWATVLLALVVGIASAYFTQTHLVEARPSLAGLQAQIDAQQEQIGALEQETSDSILVSLTPDGPVPVMFGGTATAVDLPTIDVRRFKQVSLLGRAPAVVASSVLIFASFHTEEGERLLSTECTLTDNNQIGMIVLGACGVFPVAGPLLTVRISNITPANVEVSLSAYLQR